LNYLNSFQKVIKLTFHVFLQAGMYVKIRRGFSDHTTLKNTTASFPLEH